MSLYHGLRTVRNALIHYFIKRAILLLDADDYSNLAKAVAPDIGLLMGIPMPLSSRQTHDCDCLSIEDELIAQCKVLIQSKDTQSLDLGCGETPRNPFQASKVYGIDISIQRGENIVQADLFTRPIPFQDASFDFVTAYDFIEHVPRTLCEHGETRFPFVQLMDEIARVLKPEGLFLSLTPAFPSQQVFQDPTHVNPITENTFPIYFCQSSDSPPLARMYGLRSTFQLISQKWTTFYLLSLMQKKS